MIREAIKEVISSIPKNWKFYKEFLLTCIWAVWACILVCSFLVEGAATIHLISLGGIHILYAILLFVVCVIADVFLSLVTLRVYNKMEERFFNDFVS